MEKQPNRFLAPIVIAGITVVSWPVPTSLFLKSQKWQIHQIQQLNPRYQRAPNNPMYWKSIKRIGQQQMQMPKPIGNCSHPDDLSHPLLHRQKINLLLAYFAWFWTKFAWYLHHLM